MAERWNGTSSAKLLEFLRRNHFSLQWAAVYWHKLPRNVQLRFELESN